MNESTAIARSEAPAGLERYDDGPRGLAAMDSMTPEVFQANIERQEAMRTELKAYVKRNMVANYHFATKLGTQELAKPMLLQEGVRNICSLFKLWFGEATIHETFLEGDHYRVRAHIQLFNAAGVPIASGDGICSTRETKYAYRKGNRTCPECHRDDTIIKGKSQYGGGWVCYEKKGGCNAKFADEDERLTSQQLGRIDNPDKADTENTVLKMAIKRAKNSACCDVPLVSELFVPQTDDAPPPKAASEPRPAPKSEPQKTKDAPAADPKRAADLLAQINELLKVKCGDGETIDETAANAVLKGRNLALLPAEGLEKLLGDLQAM